MPKPIDLNMDSFQEQVIDASGPVLVDFWSQSCPPCLQLNPEYESAAETASEVTFTKVAVQDALQLFKDYGVRGTPTMVLFRDGQEVSRQTGYMSAEQIVAWLDEEV